MRRLHKLAMAVALARHDELVEQVVTSRGGRLIKTRGEGDATFWSSSGRRPRPPLPSNCKKRSPKSPAR